jgi:Flp pilus assembly protein TadD
MSCRDNYRTALEFSPGYAEAHNNLGKELAVRGRGDEAIAHFRKAAEFKPDFIQAQFNLGLTLARGGKFDQALEHCRKALDLASTGSDTALVETIRAQVGVLRSVAPASKPP